jgi:uncharacterized Tic20 family protein
VPGEAPGSGYPPPTSGGGYNPTSGAGYTPPTSGSGYPPPTSGSGYPPPAPGYGQQPAGGYPPAGGYQAPGAYGAPGAGGPAPMGYAHNDEKTWALVAHFGGAAGMLVLFGIGGFIAPLIALLAKGNTSPTVRAHAVAALNGQLLLCIIGLVGYVLLCIGIGFILFTITGIIGIVFGIIAGLKANEGQLYKYPLSMNLVK